MTIINGAGKGKEYSNEGELIYEGEYLDGIRYNGKGVEYNYNGDLFFKGEYINGQSKGYGKIHNSNGLLI